VNAPARPVGQRGRRCSRQLPVRYDSVPPERHREMVPCCVRVEVLQRDKMTMKVPLRTDLQMPRVRTNRTGPHKAAAGPANSTRQRPWCGYSARPPAGGAGYPVRRVIPEPGELFPVGQPLRTGHDRSPSTKDTTRPPAVKVFADNDSLDSGPPGSGRASMASAAGRYCDASQSSAGGDRCGLTRWKRARPGPGPLPAPCRPRGAGSGRCAAVVHSE
jgi:hypothetical protein